MSAFTRAIEQFQSSNPSADWATVAAYAGVSPDSITETASRLAEVTGGHKNEHLRMLQCETRATRFDVQLVPPAGEHYSVLLMIRESASPYIETYRQPYNVAECRFPGECTCFEYDDAECEACTYDIEFCIPHDMYH